MSVRNCAEIGPILQEVVSRLLGNNELCRLIYFTDRNPIKEVPKDKEFWDVLGEQLGMPWDKIEPKGDYHKRIEAEWSRIKKKEIYEKLIKVVPRVGPKEFDNSVVVVRVASGTKDSNNN